MRRTTATSTLLFMALLRLLTPLRVSGQQQNQWTWKDGQGRVRSRGDLDKILAQHKLWVESKGKTGARADLSNAVLSGADLRRADLSYANLEFSDLSNAQFGGYYVGQDGADLSHAYLLAANLSFASLSDAHLEGAVVREANLFSADLDDANLKGANLADTNLDETDLTGCDLSNTDLTGASLGGTIFEPRRLPPADSIAFTRKLDSITYHFNPGPLAELRKQFEDRGQRQAERKVTYALNRQEAELAPLFERLFKFVAFDLTCRYGLSYGRPLRIVFYAWLFCSIVYVVFMHRAGLRKAKGLRLLPSGIYFVASRQSEVTTRTRRRQIRPLDMGPTKWWKLPFRWIGREWRVLRAAMFFSLMSALNIGFRDISFGRWLRLLTRREYELTAKGWARTIAGFQSLLSVYLIALWVLTYFGRPFA